MPAWEWASAGSVPPLRKPQGPGVPEEPPTHPHQPPQLMLPQGGFSADKGIGSVPQVSPTWLGAHGVEAQQLISPSGPVAHAGRQRRSPQAH